METLLDGSVSGLANAIRQRQVTSAEVVEAYLQRIAAANPSLNAVVALAAEEALIQARRADKMLGKGDLVDPLHGVPMTIKDSLDTAGVVTTWGTPGRAKFIPQEDATVVARLKKAGAILMGKSNTPELTLAFETDNPVYGRTNNPYNLDRSPGGSSGGAAAIVAVAGSPFDIGSDTGGSIRLPAHFCGIAGIKPTSGRVPRTGHAISPIGWLNALTQIGPMARYVSDLCLLLPLIAGPDWKDPAIVPQALGDPQAVELKGLRIALHTDNGIQAADPEIAAVVKAAAISLETAGAFVDERQPPGIEESFDLISKLMRGPDGGAWVKHILAEAGTEIERSSLVRYTTLQVGKADEVVALIDRWDRFRAQMLAFIAGYDLILCPVNAYPALPHDTFSGEKYPGFSYTMTYNLTGWPATVVRCGTSSDGLPLGVQVVARPWREDVTLAAALHLEEAFGGWRPP